MFQKVRKVMILSSHHGWVEVKQLGFCSARRQGVIRKFTYFVSKVSLLHYKLSLRQMLFLLKKPVVLLVIYLFNIHSSCSESR